MKLLLGQAESPIPLYTGPTAREAVAKSKKKAKQSSHFHVAGCDC